MVNGLGGVRNAQRILRRMEVEGLIKSDRYEMKVYYLSHKGRGYIGGTPQGPKKAHVFHTLMRNDAYIKLGMPKGWTIEQPITWGGHKLIPDATFKNSGEFHFVEIDRTQSIAKNLDKIKRYKELSSVIFGTYSHRPTVVWYTLSETRKRKLRKACEESGVKYVIL